VRSGCLAARSHGMMMETKQEAHWHSHMSLTCTIFSSFSQESFILILHAQHPTCPL
jgi:hypothetical protein